MAESQTEVETGIKSDSAIPNEAKNVDVRAYADDGEFATIFDIGRVDETTVEVAYRRCEAGLCEFDCELRFDVSADKSTEEWARECAEADPEGSVEAARDFWSDGAHPDEPTSDWDHSHAVQEGDEYETEHGEVWEVTTVQDDGAIRVRRVDDGRKGPNDRDTWGEEAVRSSLAHEEMARVSDGKSHELSTF